MLKKILATALAAAMIFAMAGTVFAASPFPDTAGVANEAVIARLKALGIVKGDDLGNFNPNNPITRAEFTTMVVRMLGLETAASYVATPTQFPDVTAASAWAYGYINIATNRGLIKGYEDGTFRPNNNVTQAEALTILLRALGYTDNLPGNWPIDYIMMGAELGVISTGFAPDVPATRALIATLVNNTLDENLVKEDTTASGAFIGFIGKYGAPTTLYQDAFDVTGSTYLTGIVSAVDTTNGTITIGSNPATDYVSGVAIYGKDSVSELKGQYVRATLNKDGDIIFITVTTKQEVVGEITAVDTVNLKVTVGGTQYEVLPTAEVVKNGATLTTTIAGALVAVKDASATLLFDNNGKVYRIVASLLDKEGTITAKATETSATGTVTNKINTSVGGPYNVKSSTTIVRNGATASFADLAIGDEVKFSVNGSDLVYVDAFINILEDYVINNYVADASGATIVATKDGVQTSFPVAKDSNGNLLVGMSHILANGGSLGKTYKLTLNRNGQVKAVALQTAVGPTTEKVKTIASKDQVGSGSPVVYKYRLNFTDGTAVVLDDLGTLAAATKNGVAFGSAPAAVTAAEAWAKAEPGDLYWLDGGPAVNTFTLDLFAPSVSGRVVHVAGSPNYTLENSSGQAVATFTMTFSTPVTVNGKVVLYTSPTAQASPGIATYTGKVTFGSANVNTKPAATSLTIEEFVAGTTALPVKGITSDANEYVFTLDKGDGTTVTVKANINPDDSIPDTVVMKGGVEIAAADVKIGDKLLYSTLTGQDTEYIKAAADTTAPVVQAGATATFSTGTNTLTVTFTTDEPVRKGYVWIGGVQKEAVFSAGSWVLTTTEYTTAPSTVTVAGVDYSGNVSTAVDVQVTVTP